MYYNSLHFYSEVKIQNPDLAFPNVILLLYFAQVHTQSAAININYCKLERVSLQLVSRPRYLHVRATICTCYLSGAARRKDWRGGVASK